MTNKQRARLRAEWALDTEAFAERVKQAVKKENWQFVAQASEALEYVPPPVKDLPFHLRVKYAWIELTLERARCPGLKPVTAQMVREKVNPKTPLAQYSKAFRRHGIPPFRKSSAK